MTTSLRGAVQAAAREAWAEQIPSPLPRWIYARARDLTVRFAAQGEPVAGVLKAVRLQVWRTAKRLLRDAVREARGVSRAQQRATGETLRSDVEGHLRQRQAELLRAIDRHGLRELYADALIARYVQGLERHELAAELGTSEAAAYSRVSRGRRELLASGVSPTLARYLTWRGHGRHVAGQQPPPNASAAAKQARWRVGRW